MDIYLIKWYDAFSVDRWKDNEEMKKECKHPLIIKSIGYRMAKNKKYISLTQNSGNNDSSSGLICIPRKCILKIKKL